MLEIFESFIIESNRFLWGAPMIILLFGTHLYITFKTGFIQKKMWLGIKLSFTKDESSTGDISQFGALATALASTIGTGNIIGVGTAIALGGPGAIFWCWLTGVFGISTKYAESLLAIKYRVRTRDGRMLGGPMYALERGLHSKWLGVLFAIFSVLASFGIGSGVQVNAIAKVVQTNLGIEPWIVGTICSITIAIIIFGGVKKVASICEALVPFMAIFYVAGCIIILVYNYDYIIPALRVIVSTAFTKGAVAGGLVGRGLMVASRYGIARGLFTNESGMGSAAIVAAAAQTKNPVRQALVSATGTFWDTVVLCAITGVVLVSSMLKNPAIATTGMQDGGELTSLVFAQIPRFGTFTLVVGIICFAYATILGWSYYGERCAEYLFGKRSIWVYRMFYVIVLFFAPLMSLNLIWLLADSLNALMVIPNVIAILLLSNVIKDETDKYINNIDASSNDRIPVVEK
jgi:AGCS family alanine or glycine:cation symporter